MIREVKKTRCTLRHLQPQTQQSCSFTGISAQGDRKAIAEPCISYGTRYEERKSALEGAHIR